MGSKDKGRQQEDALKAAAAAAAAKSDAAVTIAAAPDPLEERRRARVLAIDKWDTGESGPKDIRNLPGGDTSIALFNAAKQAHDAGRIGRGYGTLSDGANPTYVASLDKEMGLERDLAASGALEDNVNSTLEGNKAEMYGLSEIGNSRNMGIAGLRSSADQAAQDRYTQFLMRPKQPSFLKQLALAGISGASQVGAAYAGCVTLDTLVQCAFAARPIGDVEEGDLIQAYDGEGNPKWARVISIRRQPAKVMEIHAGGKVLRCTSSHVLQRFAADMSEIPAARFKPGHSVLMTDAVGNFGRQRIERIVPMAEEQEVAILKLDNENENFAFETGGFLSLDDFRAEQFRAVAA